MTLRAITRGVTTAIIIAVGSACFDDQSFCLDGGRDWGISVDVRDSLSGIAIADSALGIVRDGSFIDTLTVVGFVYRRADSSLVPYTLGGVNRRYGTYDVTVDRPGYEEWALAAVRVAPTGPCFAGVHLVASLSPAPP